MAEPASFIDEGVDRFQSAVRNVEDEFGKIQKDVRKRRKQIEKTAEKQVRRLRREISKNPVVKRTESFLKDASKQIENGIESVLDGLRIASRSDLRRIDRKLNQINRKLKELEKSEAQRARAARPQAVPRASTGA